MFHDEKICTLLGSDSMLGSGCRSDGGCLCMHVHARWRKALNAEGRGLLVLQKDTMFFPVFSPHPNLSIFCSIRDDMLARIFTCTNTGMRAHVPCWSWWKNIKIWEIWLIRGMTNCFQGSTTLPITHLSKEIVRSLLTEPPGHENYPCTDREEERSVVWEWSSEELEAYSFWGARAKVGLVYQHTYGWLSTILLFLQSRKPRER